MTLMERYRRAKQRLLTDPSICAGNRRLFADFLSGQEYKLRRVNGLASLDEGCYKTLLSYTTRLRVVHRWFGGKSWRALDRDDIQRVYDALEDGRILTRRGTPLKDKRTYYKMVLRGKPFALAGKTALVNEVMQHKLRQPAEEVRFIKEDAFRRLVEVCPKMEQRLFLWLCFDIGENASAILRLVKRDCTPQVNEHTGQREYLINLRRDILKRSRKPRSEFTNYQETVSHLDLHLKALGDEDRLFDFGEGWAKKFLLRAVQRTGVRSLPGGQRLTLKDLRSSMACDLLSKGWSRDEVNARLGHVPSSREIDRYINYLALDKARPKQKLQEHQLGRLSAELEQLRQKEKLLAYRLQQLDKSSQREIDQLRRLVALHSQIAEVTIQRQLGQVDDQELLDRLTDLFEQLRASEKPAKELDFEDLLARG